MVLPKENPQEEERVINTLVRIRDKYRESRIKQYPYNWYFRNYKFIWYMLALVLLLIVAPALGFYISIEIFGVSVVGDFTISLVFSIFAFIISIVSLLIRLLTIMDYPIDDLIIYPLDLDEKSYELQFMVKNCGHGKLKLDLAVYFIESKTPEEIFSEYEDAEELTDKSFLRCETTSMDTYLTTLIERIDKSMINIYSLKELTRDFNVYYTHDDTHVESRVHRFEVNKIYLVTFLFLTSRKIFYYTSKHVRT